MKGKWKKRLIIMNEHRVWNVHISPAPEKSETLTQLVTLMMSVVQQKTWLESIDVQPQTLTLITKSPYHFQDQGERGVFLIDARDQNTQTTAKRKTTSIFMAQLLSGETSLDETFPKLSIFEQFIVVTTFLLEIQT